MVDLSMLWPHQHETYQYVLNHPLSFCTSSPGTGKSLPHLKVAETLLARGECSRVVVVCPKTLMRTTWAQEIQRYVPMFSYALAEAPDEQRRAAFISQCPIVIINSDGVTWLAKQPVPWLKQVLGPQAMLIVDESTAFKNPRARRTKALLRLAPLFTRRYLLSGTPAPNTVTELWAQMYILDLGQRLGRHFSKFRSLVQRPRSRGAFTLWEDIPDARILVKAMIEDVIIHHDFDEVMTLVPQLQHLVYYYELPPKHYQLYKQLERTAYLEYKHKQISAVNAGVLANKLLQAASGATYSDDQSYVVFDEGRYEYIVELVQERSHSLVFFHWHHQRDLLAQFLKKEDISYEVIDGTVTSTKQRAKIIEDFQAGKYQTLLLHPLSAAHGVTLTQADTVIWASPTYQHDIYQQGIARIRRGLQRQKTQSIIVLAKNTRDELCYETFVGRKEKNELFSELLRNVQKDS